MKTKNANQKVLPRVFSFTGGARNDPLRSVHVQLKVVQTKPKGKLHNNRSTFHINLLSVLYLIGNLSRDTIYQTVHVQFVLIRNRRTGYVRDIIKEISLTLFSLQVVNQ